MTTSTQIFGDLTTTTTMQESDIPDIFDVLEGGENDNAVKFLLGFSAEEAEQVQSLGRVQSLQHPPQLLTTPSASTSALTSTTSSFSASGPARKKAVVGEPEPGLTKEGKPRKRDPVDPNRCVFSCDSCSKAFTTKFNLKRHINLHCNKSKEAGVPVQGPPSASMPSRKKREAETSAGLTSPTSAGPKSPKKKPASKGVKQRPKSISISKPPMKGFIALPPSVSSSSSISVTTTTTVPVMSSPLQTVIMDQSRLKPLPPFQSPGSTLLPTSYPSNTVSHLQTAISQQQQHQQPVGVIPHPQPVPQQLQQPQFRQLQQRVIQQSTFQTTPTTTLRMVQSMAPQQQQQLSNQQQPQQQSQFFPQKIVRFIHPQQPGTSIISQGSVPFLQQGGQRASVYQAIPVSIVSTPGPRGIISRTIQLPQQPIPVLQTLSNVRHQFKPMTLEQPTSTALTMTTSTNGQMPLLATNVSSFMPLQQQRIYIQQPSSGTFVPSATTSGSLPTPTASITTTFLPMSSLPSVSLDSDLSCPPDEIFDSEDGGDATTNDADVENTSASAVKSLPSLSSSVDKNSLVSLSEPNEADGISEVNAFFDAGFESNHVELSEISRTPLNLPTNRPRGVLLEIPRGWVRKLVTTGKGPRVFYYNTMGKKFSNPDEINQYFLRLGQSVKPGLFNFEPSKSSEDLSSVHFLNGKPASEAPSSEAHPMPIVST